MLPNARRISLGVKPSTAQCGFKLDNIFLTSNLNWTLIWITIQIDWYDTSILIYIKSQLHHYALYLHMLRRNLTLLNFYQYGELIHRGIVCVPIYLASMSNPVNRVSCEPRHMGDSHTFLSAWENYYQHFQKITITNIILSENYCRTSLCLRLRRNLSPKLFAYISSEHVIDIPFRLRYNDLCCSLMVYILRIQVWAWLQRFLILYIRRHDWQQRSIYLLYSKLHIQKFSYVPNITHMDLHMQLTKLMAYRLWN